MRIFPSLIFSLLMMFSTSLLADYGSGKSGDELALEIGLKAYRNRDYSRAYQVLRPLANRGNAKAQNKMGDLYYYGRGGAAQDYYKAFNWFKKAANQGHAGAQFSLGIMYSLARGTSKNDSVAENWFKKSASQNNSYAMAALGILYEGRRDYSNAITWYIKSAKLRNRAAMYKIGYYYELGRALPRDRAKAIKWYRFAAKRGYGKARKALRRLGVEE